MVENRTDHQVRKRAGRALRTLIMEKKNIEKKKEGPGGGGVVEGGEKGGAELRGGEG